MKENSPMEETMILQQKYRFQDRKRMDLSEAE
jgi:hypothetical protein